MGRLGGLRADFNMAILLFDFLRHWATTARTTAAPPHASDETWLTQSEPTGDAETAGERAGQVPAAARAIVDRSLIRSVE